jgi:hypothetical protein
MTFLSSPITFSGKFNDPASPHSWSNIFKQHHGFSTLDWKYIEDIPVTMANLSDLESLKTFFQANKHYGLLLATDLNKVTMLHNVRITDLGTITGIVGNKLVDLPREFKVIPEIFKDIWCSTSTLSVRILVI